MAPKTIWVEFMGRDVQIGWEPCTCKPSRMEAEEAERMAEADERRLWLQRVERAGIPARFANVDAEAGERWSAAADVYAKALRQSCNVVAYGPVGTGKTRLACYLALKMLESGRSVRFTTSTKMLLDVRSSYDSGMSESAVLRKYTEPDVLILDDLGQERATDWALETLFTVIDERSKQKRPTVVTMQAKPSKVMAHFAECDELKAYALISRLAATEEGAKVVPFEGRDHRVKVNAS